MLIKLLWESKFRSIPEPIHCMKWHAKKQKTKYQQKTHKMCSSAFMIAGCRSKRRCRCCICCKKTRGQRLRVLRSSISENTAEGNLQRFSTADATCRKTLFSTQKAMSLKEPKELKKTWKRLILVQWNGWSVMEVFKMHISSIHTIGIWQQILWQLLCQFWWDQVSSVHKKHLQKRR